jgi:hypothetical protein
MQFPDFINNHVSEEWKTYCQFNGQRGKRETTNNSH